MNNLHFTSCTAVVYYVSPHSLVALVVKQVLLFASSPCPYVLLTEKKKKKVEYIIRVFNF